MNKRKEFMTDTRNVLIFCALLILFFSFAKWIWSAETVTYWTENMSKTVTCTSAAGSTSCF